MEIARGGSPRPIQNFLTDDPNGINWIKIGDTSKTGKYINSTKEKIIPEGMKKSRFVHKGDFLLTNSMSFGRPYILNIEGCIHDGWLVISNIYQLYSMDYLYYLLSSPFAHSQFSGKVSGAVVKNLNSNKVADSLFPLPPLSEQKRIVRRIEFLEPYVEEYDKAASELTALNDSFPEQIKKSILQYAIQGKLVPQDPSDEPASVLLEKIKTEKQKLIKAGKIKKDKQESYIYKRDNRHYEKMGDKEVDITDEIPFEIPNSWVWVRLGNVVNYGETPTVSYPQCQDKNMWILDLEDIEKDTSKLLSRYRIKDKKFNSTKKTFCKGNVLYCKLRPYLNKVMVADEDGICTSEIIPLQIYYGIVPEYLKECLKSPYFYQYVNSLTYGIKMPRLGTTNGKRSLIPLPPIQEQQRIVEKIEQLFKTLS